MTSEEARQKVSSCESDIHRAYSEMWRSAKAVGTSVYDETVKEKIDIEQDAKHRTEKKTEAIFLIPLLGIAIWAFGHPVMGFIFIIPGTFAAYWVFALLNEGTDIKIKSEDSILKEITKQQAQLNSVLEKNRNI